MMYASTMNKLSRAERVLVLKLLTEGMGVNAIGRTSGVSKPSILKLLVDIGQVCSDYQDATLRNLPCKRIQCDEIWAFVQAKDKTIERKRGDKTGRGSIWTWTAICADTKLMPSFMVGARDGVTADMFMHDLAGRLRHRVQLTTDGHSSYLQAVENNFGPDIDYAMLIKQYGNDEAGNSTPERRYSPGECTGTRIETIKGGPDPAHISTSYVERANLTIRMHNRRFTRLTNGHSKKAENHVAHFALHAMFYNFCKIHMSLRITPAMAAGVTDRVWNLDDVVALLEATEESAAQVATRRKDRKS